MKKILLVGESSWDLEAFTKCLSVPDKVLLHNDYFSKSNKANTMFLRRFLTLIYVFFLVFYSVLKNRQIYFSSLNAEVLTIANLFSRYSYSYIFLPNVIGDPKWYNKRLQRCFHKFHSKIIVSDEVTYKNLRNYKCKYGNDFFKFTHPDRNIANLIKYIVVLPASLSHSNLSSENAMKYYDFSFSIYNELKRFGHEVYALPHPRDREYFNNIELDLRLISSEQIKSMGDDVCYISGHSSLSLNKRYGGKYGVWVCNGNKHGLHPSLLKEKKTLVDIKFFEG
ncbi:hypothetical protein [Vibrio fluvialis]|uniref:hypothetical protein n=1 Tax=Vibrio fluvialis TaxID=676 RepID=UPI00130230CD|nr:hypothetical protein [Vibrio fluvialis]EKO3514580.1 hypothetical protein [Vibrio fluvialis]MCE7608042.1 hypothetical protein [Vibrio fluvialis]UPO64895.1 hypothetical protein [Vibrio fluvialis]